MTVLNADTVAVATLMKYDLARDATTIVSATFSIDETLKGDPPKTLNVPINRAFRTFEGWVEGKSRMLLARTGGTYKVIELTDPHLAVLRSDLTVLRDAQSVVRAVRETVSSVPGPTTVDTMLLSVPWTVAKFVRPTSGMGLDLEVPIDSRLERWALASYRSKDPMRRLEAATALGHFKSEKNIAVLKGMLTDPSFGNTVGGTSSCGRPPTSRSTPSE